MPDTDHLIIRNQTRSTLLGERIGLADNPKTRNVGLLKHTHLDEGEGLWIIPTQAIHTFMMKFAIDLVFVDKHKRVTKVVAALKPSRMAMSWRAQGVVELPPGTAQATHTQAGDQLEFERIRAR